MYQPNSFIQALLLFPAVAYLYAYLSQVINNFCKQNAVEAQSLHTLFLTLWGLGCMSFYLNAYGLPLSYRVSVPICFFLTLVMVMQNYFFRKDKGIQKLINYLLCTTVICTFFVSLFFMLFDFMSTAYAIGWGGSFFLFFTLIPQMYRNYLRQSTQGLHVGYMSGIFLAACVELSVGIYLHWPLPTIVNSIRGVLFISIIIIQFFYYRRR